FSKELNREYSNRNSTAFQLEKGSFFKIGQSKMTRDFSNTNWTTFQKRSFFKRGQSKMTLDFSDPIWTAFQLKTDLFSKEVILKSTRIFLILNGQHF
ncbi:hypothetical protein KSS87_019883, partial [Heliosperma pusillum]